MGEALRPCPLCGSTDVACFAEECGDSYDGTPTFRAVVGCCGCHEEGCDPTYDEEPCFGIEAYFRADHPLVRDCEDPWDIERVLEHHMAERWNRRAERTCHIDMPVIDWETGETDYVCSVCGFSADPQDWAETYDYCPRCGSRVVTADADR